MKEYPKIFDIEVDLFDNIFNQVFMGELYLMEAHGIIVEACKVEDNYRLLSIEKLNDLTDLY